jgi:hypothetical protein
MSMFFLFPLLLVLSGSCNAKNEISKQNMIKNTNPIIRNKLKIKIGEKTFSATLSDNPTAVAFKALLPLTIKMNELNNNEKYGDLPESLSINPAVPASIQTGDLMMYGSKTLVLFYKGLSTSYSYTKIGKIDEVAGLEAALGFEAITITLTIESEK